MINPFYDAVGPMLGLVMCLSMVFPLAMLIRGVRMTAPRLHRPCALRAVRAVLRLAPQSRGWRAELPWGAPGARPCRPVLHERGEKPKHSPVAPPLAARPCPAVLAPCAGD